MQITTLLSFASLAMALPSNNLDPRVPSGSKEPTIEVKIKPAPTISAAQLDLINFVKVAGLQVFPNHTSWETSFDQYMDPSINAVFATPKSGVLAADGSPGLPPPATKLTFTQFKQVWRAVFQSVSTDLKSLVIDFVDVVAYPFPDGSGGFVYATGYEHGTFKNGSATYAVRDGLFAQVKISNGTKTFVEWREATNFVAAASSS